MTLVPFVGRPMPILWTVFQSQGWSLHSPLSAIPANRRSLSPITFSSRSGRLVMEFRTTLIPALLPVTLFCSGRDFVIVSCPIHSIAFYICFLIEFCWNNSTQITLREKHNSIGKQTVHKIIDVLNPVMEPSEARGLEADRTCRVNGLFSSQWDSWIRRHSEFYLLSEFCYCIKKCPKKGMLTREQ